MKYLSLKSYPPRPYPTGRYNNVNIKLSIGSDPNNVRPLIKRLGHFFRPTQGAVPLQLYDSEPLKPETIEQAHASFFPVNIKTGAIACGRGVVDHCESNKLVAPGIDGRPPDP